MIMNSISSYRRHISESQSAGSSKTLGNGRNITFTRSNPTGTFKAVKNWLEQIEKVSPDRFTEAQWKKDVPNYHSNIDVSEAKTKSRYIRTILDGVFYDFRFSNHTKSYTGEQEYNDNMIDIEFDDDDNSIASVNIDMSRLKSFTINDFKSIIEEVNKFNTHPDDGHNNPADYPVLNRYNNLKLSMDSHIEYVEEKHQMEQERNQQNTYMNEYLPLFKNDILIYPERRYMDDFYYKTSNGMFAIPSKYADCHDSDFFTILVMFDGCLESVLYKPWRKTVDESDIEQMVNDAKDDAFHNCPLLFKDWQNNDMPTDTKITYSDIC